MYQNPELETLLLRSSNRSIKVFAREDVQFEPFWHYHPEIELTLITNGSGIRFVGDSIENYQSGDLALIGQNVPHQWVSSHEPNSGHGAIVVQFRAELFDKYVEFEEIRALLRSALNGLHFPEADNSVQTHLQKIVSQPSAIQVSSLISLLADLIESDARQLSTTTKFNALQSGDELSRMNNVMGYVLENLDSKITVSEIAARCFMVPQSFCRWFKQNTGSSFITYLNKTRIESACRRLLTSNESVAKIAYDVGFDNISHFNRTFKKYTGKAPLEFRRQRR